MDGTHVWVQSVPYLASYVVWNITSYLEIILTLISFWSYGALFTVFSLYFEHTVVGDAGMLVSFKLTLTTLNLKGQGTGMHCIQSFLPHANPCHFLQPQATIRLFTFLMNGAFQSRLKTFLSAKLGNKLHFKIKILNNYSQQLAYFSLHMIRGEWVVS